MPAVEFRNAERASLFGARIVMLVALLRVETIAGCVARRPGMCEWNHLKGEVEGARVAYCLSC